MIDNAVKYTFERGDRVYARLSRNGENIVEYFIESAKSVQDIVHFIISQVGRGVGLTKLYIRNMSQGWSGEKSILIR